MKKLMMAVVLVSLTLLVPAFAADKDLPLPTDDKFLVKAVECTMAEMAFADQAIKRASSPEVKQLAQQLKDEHNDCFKRLMEHATKRKLAVVEGLDKEHRDIADRLGKLEGKEFDREYVRGVIDRHQRAVNMFEGQTKDGKVAELNALCKEALPKLKQHIQEAQKVQDKIKN